jgi:hypothetical protein
MKVSGISIFYASSFRVADNEAISNNLAISTG